jgi:Protein of unknown function (DUF1674)
MTSTTQGAPPRADSAAALRWAQVPISPNDPAVPVPPVPTPPPGPDLPEAPVKDPPGPDAPLPGEDPNPTPAGDPPSDAPVRRKEIGGPAGPEPTRYGDWERKGRACDF